MQIIVIHLQTEQGRFELGRRVAEMHAGFVVGAVNWLGCPARQELQLVDAVIRKLESKAKKTAV